MILYDITYQLLDTWREGGVSLLDTRKVMEVDEPGEMVGPVDSSQDVKSFFYHVSLPTLKLLVSGVIPSSRVSINNC